MRPGKSKKELIGTSKNKRYMQNQSLVSKLSEHLFWDVDKSKLDTDRNKTYIIERVFSRGDLDDMKILCKIYDTKTIRKEIKKAGALDNKTLNWAVLFLNLNKTDFKCYSKTQSNTTHWNF
jgi:hypothetical protein